MNRRMRPFEPLVLGSGRRSAVAQDRGRVVEIVVRTGLTPTLYGGTIDGAIGVEPYREHPHYKWLTATNLVANHFSRPPHLVGLGAGAFRCNGLVSGTSVSSVFMALIFAVGSDTFASRESMKNWFRPALRPRKQLYAVLPSTGCVVLMILVTQWSRSVLGFGTTPAHPRNWER